MDAAINLSSLGAIIVFAIAASLVWMGKHFAAFSGLGFGMITAGSIMMSAADIHLLGKLMTFELIAAIIAGVISLIYSRRIVTLLLFSAANIFALTIVLMSQGEIGLLFLYFITLGGAVNLISPFEYMPHFLTPVLLALAAIFFVDAFIEKRPEQMKA